MKTQGLRAVVAMGLAALLLVAGAATSHAGERAGLELIVELDTRYPTPSEEIEMTIHFALPDGCYEINRGQPEVLPESPNNIQVRIRATEVPGPCPGPTDETIHRIVGPLARGLYAIGALIDVDYLCTNNSCHGEGHGTMTPVRVAVLGDANCDGSINSIDANVVLQQSAALSNVLCQQGGDANDDGEVQSIDATLILQYTAGLVGQLPPS